MTESSKYTIHTDINQIIETNTGTVVGNGDQYNYAENPELAQALTEFNQMIVDLQQKYPQATDAEIPAIVDVEFQEIKRLQPQRWRNLTRL